MSESVVASTGPKYLVDFKKVKEEIEKAKTQFKECFTNLYDNLKEEFGNDQKINCEYMKKLSAKWDQLDIDLVIPWYANTFRDHSNVLLALNSDKKVLDKFCLSKQYILPGIKPLQLLSEEELKNDSINAQYLKKTIKDHLPLLYIYSEILVLKENGGVDINKQMDLLRIKNRIISSINSSKIGSALDSSTSSSNGKYDMLKQYANMAKNMKSENEKKNDQSSIPSINIGMISLFLQHSGIGTTLETEFREKIKLGLNNGSLERMSSMIVEFYKNKGLNDTAEVLKNTTSLILNEFKNIRDKDNMINKMLNIANKVVTLVKPEIDNGKLKPKDIFAAILDTIQKDPTGRGKKLEGPLLAVCAFLDNGAKNKDATPEEAKNVISDLFCAVGNCDKKQVDSAFKPIFDILDEVKTNDGSLDPFRLMEAINNFGGIDKLQELFQQLKGNIETVKPENIPLAQTESVDNPIVENKSSDEELFKQMDQKIMNMNSQNIKNVFNDPEFMNSDMVKQMMDPVFMNTVINDPFMQQLMANVGIPIPGTTKNKSDNIQVKSKKK
jgi:hypothetical protein